MKEVGFVGSALIFRNGYNLSICRLNAARFCLDLAFLCHDSWHRWAMPPHDVVENLSCRSKGRTDKGQVTERILGPQIWGFRIYELGPQIGILLVIYDLLVFQHFFPNSVFVCCFICALRVHNAATTHFDPRFSMPSKAGCFMKGIIGRLKKTHLVSSCYNLGATVVFPYKVSLSG